MTSIPTTLRRFDVDRLRVQVESDASAAGNSAALAAAQFLRERLRAQECVRVIFAAAPSQDRALASLVAQPGIDWARVVAFHMDEYVGLHVGDPRSFGRYLTDRLFNIVRPGAIHLINGTADAEQETRRYAAEVTAAPIDLVLLGVGENGHIAFNEPGSAIDDEAPMRLVTLQRRSRQQQVNDGCFDRLTDVPTHALTLTVPTLLSARSMVAVVVGALKRESINQMLRGPVCPQSPASWLRLHAQAMLYLDQDAYSKDGFTHTPLDESTRRRA